MIYITFGRGGPKLSNTTARALHSIGTGMFNVFGMNLFLKKWIGRFGKEDLALQS
jgi:hypothetical protein